jgi:hypothetical protein
MTTRKQAEARTGPARAAAAIKSNIQKLVRLLADPDDATGNEACVELYRLAALAAEPLAAAILRPKSPVDRLRAMFLVRFLPPDVLSISVGALLRVIERERDEGIRGRAILVLSELIEKRMEAKVSETLGENPPSPLWSYSPTVARSEQPIDPAFAGNARQEVQE